MTAVTRPLLLSLMLAVSLHAQDASSVARMVNDSSLDPAVLAKSLESTDALTRATAARVALVRNVSIVPALRAQLAKESNADAARELVRAIAILGDTKDADFASQQLSRFPATIDMAFADALARASRGADRYLHKLRAVPVPRVTGGLRASEAPGVSTPVNAPVFAVPLILPRGLAAAILGATRCKTGWSGVAEVTRDEIGRVQNLETKNVLADRGCMEAFRTIARLSLADPGPAATTPLLVLRVEGAPPCFDESALSDVMVSPENEGGITTPKPLRRVEPDYPRSVRMRDGGTFSVMAEATITSEGCIRDVRLVRQTIYPELNRSAIEALSKWTFTPGTLNGVPVDVLFTITLTFRH